MMRVDVGLPELQQAIATGQARMVLMLPLSEAGLGPAPIELRPDEEIIARSPVEVEGGPGGPAEAEAVLIVQRAALPRLRITAGDPRVAELARVLMRGGQS